MKTLVWRSLIMGLSLALIVASLEVGTVNAQIGATNSIVIRGQDLGSGQVWVDRVIAAQDGWLVIHRDDSGKPGYPIGFAPVHKGTNTNFMVDIQPTSAEATEEGDNITAVLWAILHIDQGVIGEFEYPGPDVPVAVAGKPVMVAFATSPGPAPAPAAMPAPTTAAEPPKTLPPAGASQNPAIWIALMGLAIALVATGIVLRRA